MLHTLIGVSVFDIRDPLQSTYDPVAAFSMESDAGDADRVNLRVSPPGSRMAPTLVWTRTFDTPEDRDAFLEMVLSRHTDLLFLGRLTMIFGGAHLDALSDRVVLAARDARQQAANVAAELAEKHVLVRLHTSSSKRGHMLELRRASRDTADWTVIFDRASERDRLCDWLRWQTPRFLAFLDHAAAHGSEALARLLTDEMFQTERRVKTEGRGAGGNRPLRMWRGD